MSPKTFFRACWPEVLACLVFLASRGVVWNWSAKYPEDVNRYAEWAIEYQEARSRGQGLYAYHEDRVRGELEARRAQGKETGGEEYLAIEYPPLALDVLLAPTFFLKSVPSDPEGRKDWVASYVTLYRLMMALFDAATFFLVLWLVSYLFPREVPFQRLERFLVYVAGSSALGFVLYNRMDACLALLVTLGTFFLLVRFHYFWAFLILGLGVHFKLIPLVLAPVWALGSMPVLKQMSAPDSMRKGGMAFVQRSAVMVGLLIGLMVPYFLTAGERGFAFLAYHRDRGIEIESVYGNLLMAGHLTGEPFEVYESHGSYNVRGTGSEWLTRISPLALALWLGILVLVLFRALIKKGGEATEADETQAQARPHLFVHFAFLFLLVSVAVSKVFSPQYLIWVLPLGVLVDWQGRGRWMFFGGLTALCFLTGWIYPFLFWKDVAGLTMTAEGREVYQGFTMRGFWVLTVRNALALGLALGLSVRFARGGEVRRGRVLMRERELMRGRE